MTFTPHCSRESLQLACSTACPLVLIVSLTTIKTLCGSYISVFQTTPSASHLPSAEHHWSFVRLSAVVYQSCNEGCSPLRAEYLLRHNTEKVGKNIIDGMLAGACGWISPTSLPERTRGRQVEPTAIKAGKRNQVVPRQLSFAFFYIKHLENIY